MSFSRCNIQRIIWVPTHMKAGGETSGHPQPASPSNTCQLVARAHGPRAELWPERAWAKQDKTQGATAGAGRVKPSRSPSTVPTPSFQSSTGDAAMAQLR